MPNETTAPVGPWMKYQQQPKQPAQGPWTKYGRAASAPAIIFDDLIPPENRRRPPLTFDNLIPSQGSRTTEPAAPQTIQIEASDGVIVEFPSGTDPSTIEATMRRHQGGRPMPAVSANMSAATHRMFPKADPSAATPAAEPAENDGWNAPLYVAQRANRGLADLVGGTVDLAAGGVNAALSGADLLAGLFGGSVDARVTDPIGGAQWIADRAAETNDMLGGKLVDSEEVSPMVRILGEGARFGTAGLMGGAGLASRAAQTVSQAPTAAGRLLNSVSNQYRKSVRPIVGDTAAGFGSGAAVGAYDDLASEDVKDSLGPIGPIAAALAGGAGGVAAQSAASGIGRAGVNAARDVVTGKGDPRAPMRDDGSRRYTRGEMDQTARLVQAQASNPATAARAIAEETDAIQQFASSGQAPTTGGISDDVGLQMLEREARTRNPRPFMERDRATTAKAGDLVRSNAPAGSTGRDFTEAATNVDQQRVTGARERLGEAEQARSATEAAERARAQEIGSYAGQRTSASQELDREVVEGSLRPMQERKNTAFAAIDPDRSLVRDATPLVEAARDIRASLGRLNDPSSILPTRTLDRIEALAGGRQSGRTVDTGLFDASGAPITRSAEGTSAADGTITFDEINALRPELNGALTKARTAGDFALADNIQRLQGAINAETKRLAGEATPAGRRAADAERIYTEEFAPTWNAGPGDEARRFRRDFNIDRQNRTTTPPSATAGRFLRPGEPEKATSLRRTLDSLPNAAAAEREARRYLLADLAESGIVDSASGTLRPDALVRWSQQWGGSLDVVPSMRAEIDGLIEDVRSGSVARNRLAADVRRAEAAVDDATKNKGALGLVLGKDPINAVSSVFSSGDPERAMSEIVDRLGSNDRARQGLKAATADFLADQVTGPALQRTIDGSRPVDFGALENVFNRHQKTLANVYTPDEMNTLRQAHRLLKPQRALRDAGSGATMSDTKKAEQAWRLLEGGLKAKFGVLKGGGVLRTIRIFAETLPNSGEAVGKIVERMHFDPELAGHLLTRQVEPDSPAWNAKLNRLLAAAAGARESVED